LGPLVEVPAVFDGQGVQVEAIPEQLELCRVLRQEVDPAQDLGRRRGHALRALGKLHAPVAQLHHTEHGGDDTPRLRGTSSLIRAPGDNHARRVSS
jgi:hypothetical protein